MYANIQPKLSRSLILIIVKYFLQQGVYIDIVHILMLKNCSGNRVLLLLHLKKAEELQTHKGILTFGVNLGSVLVDFQFSLGKQNMLFSATITYIYYTQIHFQPNLYKNTRES